MLASSINARDGYADRGSGTRTPRFVSIIYLYGEEFREVGRPFLAAGPALEEQQGVGAPSSKPSTPKQAIPPLADGEEQRQHQRCCVPPIYTLPSCLGVGGQGPHPRSNKGRTGALTWREGDRAADPPLDGDVNLYNCPSPPGHSRPHCCSSTRG